MSIKKISEILPVKLSWLIPYFENPAITDILVNGTESFFIEESGQLKKQEVIYSLEDLYFLIEKLITPLGKQMNASKPFLDGRLEDGSRFHILLPPLSSHGPLISIRKQKNISQFQFSDFCSLETESFLRTQISQKKNLLIAGSTGSGKTTLLRLLIDSISKDERLLALEECQELSVSHPHFLSLETRVKNTDGFGEVTLSELFRNALRMRPDRIFIGECRGKEALDMLQAMNCGQVGSMTTLHANHALDALKRLESLVCLSGYGLPISVVREWIANSFHYVLFLKKVGAKRSLVEVIELCGLEGDRYRFSPIL